jgi:protein-S-isoprenylcysteine O-methyltransferase Ste14
LCSLCPLANHDIQSQCSVPNAREKVLYKNTGKDVLSMSKLIVSTLRTFVIGAVALGLILFLSAWTVKYWQAWVFIVVFNCSANAIGLYLSIKDPALLERRKKVGPAAEQNTAQRIIMSIAFAAISGLLVFCALDFRFGWSRMPAVVAVIGDLLVILGLLINLVVFRENTFGASTIKTEADQKVISTGPYALVRHPMYAGVLVMLSGVPLALGSWWGLLFLVLALPMLAWRILDEEKLLRKDLPGYVEYTHKVRYRLIPYLW